MNIADFITELYCQIDDALPDVPHHSQANLSLSELITIGVLQAMKQDTQRAFYHWLKDNYGHLFPQLPGRTRLNRRLRAQRGRPRRRPMRLYADRAYGSRRHRQELRARHIAPVLARRGAEHGSGLGVRRWVVERPLGWLHQFRRLRVRYERRADIHEPFLSLGCSIICFRRLTSFC